MRLRQVLDTIKTFELTSFSGRDGYKDVRLARALIFAFGCVPADTEDCWYLLSNMSDHLRCVCGRIGLMDHHFALCIRDLVRAETGMEKYSLSDLAIFLCLVEFHE